MRLLNTTRKIDPRQSPVAVARFRRAKHKEASMLVRESRAGFPDHLLQRVLALHTVAIEGLRVPLTVPSLPFNWAPREEPPEGCESEAIPSRTERRLH